MRKTMKKDKGNTEKDSKMNSTTRGRFLLGYLSIDVVLVTTPLC